MGHLAELLQEDLSSKETVFEFMKLITAGISNKEMKDWCEDLAKHIKERSDKIFLRESENELAERFRAMIDEKVKIDEIQTQKPEKEKRKKNKGKKKT